MLTLTLPLRSNTNKVLPLRSNTLDVTVAEQHEQYVAEQYP